MRRRLKAKPVHRVITAPPWFWHSNSISLRHILTLVLPGNACERQGLYCQRYEICTQESNQVNRDMSLTYVAPSPKCSCPSCPESGLGGKVCGSDGRTYRSECHLRVAACQAGHSDLEIKQRGACGEQ